MLYTNFLTDIFCNKSLAISIYIFRLVSNFIDTIATAMSDYSLHSTILYSRYYCPCIIYKIICITIIVPYESVSRAIVRIVSRREEFSPYYGLLTLRASWDGGLALSAV